MSEASIRFGASTSGIDEAPWFADRARAKPRRRETPRARDARLALQMQRGCDDQAAPEQVSSDGEAAVERAGDRFPVQRRNIPRDEPVAEVAVGLEAAGGGARDARVAGKVHAVGDDGRGGVGLRGVSVREW